MTKIKKISVQNFKAIKELEADFSGCTAIITGGNDKGKTSFLKGLIDRIQGNKPELIKNNEAGEMHNEIELTTGEKFIWSINKTGGEKLILITKEDFKMTVTRAICEKYFPSTFDIDRFLNDTPQNQKRTLQDLTGLDFSTLDIAYKEAYQDRTFANRKLAEEKAKRKPIDEELPTDLFPEDELKKEIDTIDLHNARYENAQERAIQIDKEIERLQAQLKEWQQKKKQAAEWLDNKDNKPKTNKAELQQKLINIQEKNKKIEANNKAINQEIIFNECFVDAKRADDKVKEIEQKRLELIKSANLPGGIEFTDDGILINGLPVTKEQLSSSAIYITALKLASMKLGDVKTLYFDASHLDKNNLTKIQDWADKNDLQLLIERPDFDGGEITYKILSE